MDGSALMFGIVIPAVVAGIVLLASARRAREHSASPRPFAGALALGAGFLAAYVGLKSMPALPWSDVQLDLLAKSFWTVAAAIALAPLRTAPFVARYGNSLYVALFSILPYHFLRQMDATRSALDLVGLGTVLLVYGLWIALERLAQRRSGPSLPLALWAACAGTTAMLLENRSGFQAQLVGALAAGLGAAVVVALLVRGAHLASGVIAILAIAVAGIVRQAVLYDLPTESWALVAVAFAAPWLGEIPFVRARGDRIAGAVAFLAALISSAAAAWFAHAARGPSPY